jgi:hypothetical protein
VTFRRPVLERLQRLPETRPPSLHTLQCAEVTGSWVDPPLPTHTARVRGGRPKHEERPGLISQTLEGCRRGRSGVRPLRQPVATRLLKISQKMNPKHFEGRPGTLCRRSLSLRLGILRERHPSTRPINAASTASNGATFPSRAVRQPSSASIRWSVDSAVDFRASTTIWGFRSSLISGAPDAV